MAQENYTNLSTSWVAFSSLVENFDSSATYIIYNRGPYPYMGLEADSLPAEGDDAGQPCYNNEKGIYVPGTQNLYLRAMSGETYINITKAA